MSCGTWIGRRLRDRIGITSSCMSRRRTCGRRSCWTTATRCASRNKIDYARHLAACLAYLLAMQQDLAGLVAVDETVRIELAAGVFSGASRSVVQGAGVDRGRERRRISVQHLHGLAERLPRRSLVILISDLWVDEHELVQALQHLRYRKHQAMMLHLLDQQELELPWSRQITLEDLETAGEAAGRSARAPRELSRRRSRSISQRSAAGATTATRSITRR